MIEQTKEEKEPKLLFCGLAKCNSGTSDKSPRKTDPLEQTHDKLLSIFVFDLGRVPVKQMAKLSRVYILNLQKSSHELQNVLCLRRKRLISDELLESFRMVRAITLR